MTFKSTSIAIFTLLLLCYFSKFSSCTTLQTIEEISENDLMNLAISEKPSVVLFYSPYPESEPPAVLLEYEKLPQLISSSPLEINIVKHQINTFNTLPQGFVINSLPSIKLIIDGASFEYGGPKTAVALLRHIKERFMKGLLTVSSKQKLDILLQSEKTVLVYFTQSAFCGVDFAGNSRLVRIKRSLGILANRWGSMVRFVLAKDVNEISFIEGFQAPTEGLVLFRKRHPFYVSYPHEELEPEMIDDFLLENAFSRVNVLNRTFYEFFKKEKLAMMLLIANKEDFSLAETLVNFEQEVIEHDIVLSVYWNEKEDKDGTRKMLQNLVGSARPFEQSQLFILDYSTGSLKFYRLDTAINGESIKNFYLYWRGGMLKPLLRSEFVPLATELQVQKIVGRNYLPKVMDLQYDVFVLFYFDGCGETCVKILEMIESLAKKLEPLRVLKFYRINLSLNDVPTLQLQYLPAFGGYPRSDKTLKLFDDEQISYQKVLQFIYDTTDFMTTEQFTQVKDEINAMYFDSILEDSKRKASKMSMISDFDL